VGYKDLNSLEKLVTGQGKMLSRKRSGTCARHQRQAKQAVKRARFLALLPYVAGD
jgi:small subunit ribosomal protein S18